MKDTISPCKEKCLAISAPTGRSGGSVGRDRDGRNLFGSAYQERRYLLVMMRSGMEKVSPAEESPSQRNRASRRLIQVVSYPPAPRRISLQGMRGTGYRCDCPHSCRTEVCSRHRTLHRQSRRRDRAARAAEGRNKRYSQP